MLARGGRGEVKGDMLSHSSFVQIDSSRSQGLHREQWREPRSGSLNIRVPILALLLTGSATLGKSLPCSGPQFLHLKNT